jgi:hypothetical protein
VHAKRVPRRSAHTTRRCMSAPHTVWTSGTDPHPSIHRQAETGFPELFHRWCSPLTSQCSRQSQAGLISPEHVPTDWLAGSSTPPLLFVSIPSPLVLPHLDNKNTGSQAHPSNPSAASVLLFPFAFAAQRGRYVSRQARSGMWPSSPLSRRPGIIDWIALSPPCFPSPICPQTPLTS